MDVKQALADLTEISSQIRAAVLVDDGGKVIASTLDDAPASRMADAVRELLAAADRTRPGLGPGTLNQLEVSTMEGSVFVVRDHGRVIAATTSPEPTVGLVFYDLKTCLRNAAEGSPKPQAPKPKPRRKTAAGEQAAAAEAAPKRSRRATKKEDDGST